MGKVESSSSSTDMIEYVKEDLERNVYYDKSAGHIEAA